MRSFQMLGAAQACHKATPLLGLQAPMSPHTGLHPPEGLKRFPKQCVSTLLMRGVASDETSCSNEGVPDDSLQGEETIEQASLGNYLVHFSSNLGHPYIHKGGKRILSSI